MSVFNEQVKSTDTINNSMNYLRSSAKSLVEPLMSIFNGFWQKIIIFMYHILRIYQKLHSSFSRVFGIAVSSIFSGIGMYKAIRNLMNFVILVIIIILIILLAIAAVAIYILFPVMPIIIGTLAVISASIFGATVGGMSDGFCVAPGTLVAVPGGWKPVEELKPGDALREGSVEGVLKTTGKGSKCVNLGGVIISGCHLVFHNGWISASDHPLAQPAEGSDFLYCLNTSTRNWTVKGTKEFLLRDWEELPDGYDIIWEDLIYKMLNGKTCIKSSSCGRGTLASNTLVWERSRGPIFIKDVRIGDYVKGDSTYTEVLGVYEDIECSPQHLWALDNTGTGNHSFEGIAGIGENHGYHLITSSNTFLVSDSLQLVRDFTEVGADRIHETYEFTLSLLN